MNLPNKLSLLRIILIPVFMAVFFITAIPYNYLISAIIFTVAAATDFLDGYIARKYNLVTDLGKFLDPIADKILVLSAFVVMLTEPSLLAGEFGLIFYKIAGGVGVTIIVAREMTVSVIRMLAAKKGVVLAAEKIGKFKTAVTDVAIVVLIAYGSFLTVSALYFVGVILYALAVILTVYSGIFYIVKNRQLFLESK